MSDKDETQTPAHEAPQMTATEAVKRVRRTVVAMVDGRVDGKMVKVPKAKQVALSAAEVLAVPTRSGRLQSLEITATPVTCPTCRGAWKRWWPRWPVWRLEVMDARLQAIARQHLMFDTLQARNVDGHDFKEVACWSVKAALEAAFEAAQQAALAEQEPAK